MQHIQLFILPGIGLPADSPQQRILLWVMLLLITLLVALVSRPLRLPYTLVLVIVGLSIGFSPWLPGLRLDPDTVLFLFLPILLFEGAWNVNVQLLLKNWVPIFLLAVPGLLISVGVVALIVHTGLGMDWLLACLLGAIISPTDPVAVIALLRQLGLGDRLRTIIEGESLFNDGVGAALVTIVLALLLAAHTGGTQQASLWLQGLDILWLMVGGLLLGVVVGLLVTYCLRFVHDYLVEITLTVSLAYGVYVVAIVLHTSGLLAVIGAGLVLGSYGRKTGLSERAQEAAHAIWDFLSYVINSLLFLLLGVQIGESSLLQAWPGIFLALIGVMVGRAIMVYALLPMVQIVMRRLSLLKQSEPLDRSWYGILLLSGLRGALSIALVLSLPDWLTSRHLLEEIVYGVVLFTLLGQGMSLRLALPRYKLIE